MYNRICKYYKKVGGSLKKVKMSTFLLFEPGVNPTRAQKQFAGHDFLYYDAQAFEADYEHIGESQYVKSVNDTNKLTVNERLLVEGDVVISNSLQQAVIVSASNVGKVLPINFTKVKFDDDTLDKAYFMYLFNVSTDVKRQKERELQGSGAIQRIKVSALGDIEIPFVSLAEQRKIGAVYLEALRLRSHLNKYGSLIEQFSNGVIERTLYRGE